MVVACIACGGILEVTFVVMGLGWIIRWFKKRHNKKKCKCCKDKEVKDVT